MKLRQLFISIFLLATITGCGGDSSGPASPGAGAGAAEPGKFGSLLEPGYTVEKLVDDLGGASLQAGTVLEKRLLVAIAECKEQVTKLKLDVQRFSADALLSSDARATRDSLESRRADLAILENKLEAVSKQVGRQKAAGK